MTSTDQIVTRGQDAVFPATELDGRVKAARALLAERGIDVYIVTGPENIFYLTGQQTPGYYTFQALLLPVEGEPVFVVRELEYRDSEQRGRFGVEEALEAQLRGKRGWTSERRDANGELVTVDGYKLAQSITIPNDALEVTVGQDGTVTTIQAGNPTPSIAGNILLTRFPNPAWTQNGFMGSDCPQW